MHWAIAAAADESCEMIQPLGHIPVPVSEFARFRFPPEVIVLAVRWYLRYGLSYRDVEEFLAERGIEADHVTIYRWVQRFTRYLSTRPGPVGGR